MSEKVLTTGRNATLIKLGYAAFAKICAALAGFALTVLITRNLSNTEAGLFLLGFSLTSVLSVIFRLGLDNVILRILSANGITKYAQEKFNRGILWILIATIPFIIVSILFSKEISSTIFNKPAFGPIICWFAPTISCTAIFMLFALAFQSQHRVLLSTTFQNLGISALFIVALLISLRMNPSSIDAQTSAQLYTASAVVILIASVIIWLRQPTVKFRLENFKDHELYSSCVNLWIANSMSMVSQWSGMMIAGAIIASEELAYFSAAQRTSLLVTFVLMVVNMVAAPRYARMWKDEDIKGIQRLAKYSTRGMVVASTPVMLVMVLVPDRIMSLFGKDFKQASLLLAIMAVGQFINVATGSVGYLLNMSGYESEYRKVMVASGIFSILISYVFISEFGVLGAAIGTALSVAVQNLLALTIVHRKLGFWPIG